MHKIADPDSPMPRIACVDVHYFEGGRRAALVLFDEWSDAVAAREIVEEHSVASTPYVPGEFFRRELDAILSIVTPVVGELRAIVVDGYVWLDDRGRPGLGARVREALGDAVPVIGAAKTRFRGAGGIEVSRGESVRPLIVTAVGMEERVAADAIRSMHGEHRLPTLLKRADDLARRGLKRAGHEERA